MYETLYFLLESLYSLVFLLPHEFQDVILHLLLLDYYSLLIFSSAIITSGSPRCITMVLLDLSLELECHISSSQLNLSTWIFCCSTKQLSMLVTETVVS